MQKTLNYCCKKETDRESPEYSALYARIRMVYRQCSSFLSSSLIWVYFVSPGFVCFVGVWIWILLARIVATYILEGLGSQFWQGGNVATFWRENAVKKRYWEIHIIKREEEERKNKIACVFGLPVELIINLSVGPDSLYGSKSHKMWTSQSMGNSEIEKERIQRFRDWKREDRERIKLPTPPPLI